MADGREWRGRVALLVGSAALSAVLAWALYPSLSDAWRYRGVEGATSDSRGAGGDAGGGAADGSAADRAKAADEAWEEHAAAFGELLPGVPVQLKAYPAPEMDAVPTFEVVLNELYVRERAFGPVPPDGRKRILAIGDSTTFGTGVDYGERFTEVLSGLLEERHPGCCEVLNAGRVGSTTPSALEALRSEFLGWSPSLLVYSTMSNDLRDPRQQSRLLVNDRRLQEYEEGLRAVVAACREQGVKIVFWANRGAHEAHVMDRHRAVMFRVGEELAVPVVDLEALYAAAPATAEEQAWYLANSPWTEAYGTLAGAQKVSIEVAALHTDWVHPNRFGSLRLAEGLLPAVEAELGLASAGD